MKGPGSHARVGREAEDKKQGKGCVGCFPGARGCEVRVPRSACPSGLFLLCPPHSWGRVSISPNLILHRLFLSPRLGWKSSKPCQTPHSSSSGTTELPALGSGMTVKPVSVSHWPYENRFQFPEYECQLFFSNGGVGEPRSSRGPRCSPHLSSSGLPPALCPDNPPSHLGRPAAFSKL